MFHEAVIHGINTAVAEFKNGIFVEITVVDRK